MINKMGVRCVLFNLFKLVTDLNLSTSQNIFFLDKIVEKTQYFQHVFCFFFFAFGDNQKDKGLTGAFSQCRGFSSFMESSFEIHCNTNL